MLAALGVVVAWLWLTNPFIVPVAVIALALVSRALNVPQLEEEARLDPKTGLANTRHFHEVFQQELARAARYRRPLAVIVADLDYFREVNNTHGHLTGDDVLKGIADLLRENVRDMDTAARFGGE
jgi:PleD family two-component response regulator